jgi:hypothetical protein
MRQVERGLCWYWEEERNLPVPASDSARYVRSKFIVRSAWPGLTNGSANA